MCVHLCKFVYTFTIVCVDTHVSLVLRMEVCFICVHFIIIIVLFVFKQTSLLLLSLLLNCYSSVVCYELTPVTEIQENWIFATFT